MNNIFESIPKNLETEIFEKLVDHDNVRIERIISKGHTSAEDDWYDQEKNEWVMVLQGEAILAFVDGRTVTMNVGDYLEIKAHEKHRVQWTSHDTETIWLTVFY